MKYAPRHGREVAIIGMALRFPGADGTEEFWENLRGGVESVESLTYEQVVAAGADPALAQSSQYVRMRASMREPYAFDAAFFGYTPAEARLLDPQQRVFLECCWEALEAAGYDPLGCPGRVGVFAGGGMNWYFEKHRRCPELREASGFQKLITADKDFLPTRVAYHLNLTGPAINVQTACSTSLVVVHEACQSLTSGDCDVALAGAVAINPYRDQGYLYQEGMIRSPDGRCRAFDARSGGTIFGSGVAVLVLKPLERALQDQDTIQAVIKGTAVNNDGSAKVGYTAPSVAGQREVILAALAASGCEASTVTYVEGHGTGTALGDPVEVTALTQAFRVSTQQVGFCGLGSVKSNFGHLDTVAGMAGLIKVVLAMQRGELPPSLHFESPNPHIDLAGSPFYVVDRLTPWETHCSRRAGVSSFGIGGTNAHVVLEEAPESAPPEGGRTCQLVPLSAPDPESLERLQARLGPHLAGPALADAAYTLTVGRHAFAERTVAIIRPGDPVSFLPPTRAAGAEPDLVFLFPGQGSQYLGMARALAEQEPVFRDQLRYCCEVLRTALELDLWSLLYAGSDPALLNRTDLAQSSLFAVECSLATLLQHWGLRPRATLGHSVGEYVSAWLAGVMTLEDALLLVARRGILMRSRPPGGMVAVALSGEAALLRLTPGLAVAAFNSASACVVSGPFEELEAWTAGLQTEGIVSRPLHASHAFHSSMMDPILPAFEECLEGVSLQAPQLPYLSNLTGEWVTAEQTTSPAYWVNHLRGSVRFTQSLERLLAEFRSPYFLEVGPGTTLTGLARQHRAPGEIESEACLPAPQEAEVQDSLATTLRAVGRFWMRGGRPNWDALYAGQQRRKVSLPGYPFERQIHDLADSGPPPVDLELREENQSPLLFVPSWRRTARLGSGPQSEPETILALVHERPLASLLLEALAEKGHRVVRVFPGESFDAAGHDLYRVNPGQSEDFRALLGAVAELPSRLLYGWTLLEGAELADDYRADDFFSLAWLLQAWPSGHPLQIVALSDELTSVGRERIRAPERATMLPALVVVEQEYARMAALHVDLERDFTESLPELIRECLRAGASGSVAYRGTRRWTQSYEPLSTPPSPLGGEPGGAYLITGGLGGLGLTVAEHLFQTGQARLALLGRGRPPEDGPAQAILQRLASQGAEVMLVSADVTDEKALRQALGAVRARLGPLAGVVHAAGTSTRIPLEQVTVENCWPIMAAKVQGTHNLHRCLREEPVPLMLYFSSLAAPLGGWGLGAYGGGNAFLDAQAESASAVGSQRTVSINWGAWQEIGMAARTQARQAVLSPEASYREAVANLVSRQQTEEMMRHALPTQTALDALTRVLASQEERVLVAAQDLRRGPARSDLARPASPAGTSARRHLSADFVAPSTPTEQQVTEVWQKVLGFSPLGARDDFFELGGNSLLAAQILARLLDAFQLQISLRSLFEARTVAEMALLIDNLHWANSPVEDMTGIDELIL